MSILVSVADRIATITIDRADKLNALNAEVLDGLGRAVDEVRRRDDVGGVIVTGAGRAFVAGADIAQFTALTPESARAFAVKGQGVFRAFETLRKPVIAAVNGFALGGGCELALACHLRVASEHAKFGQPEVKLGLIAGYGGTQRLPRLVGRGVATQLLLTGEMIDAQEALRIGLVNAVVPAGELMGTTTALLQAILAQGPLAVAATLEAIDRGLDGTLEAGMAYEAELFGRLASTADQKEGAAAFLEKRPPRFAGR
jgi:enoyl-CoA hydratase